MAIIDIDLLSDDDDDDQVNDQKAEHVASPSGSKKGFIGKSWDWFCAGIRKESSFSWLKFMASAAVPISVTFLTLQQMDAASNQQRHEIMSTYLEEMKDLLVDKGLRLSDSNEVSSTDAEAKAKAEQRAEAKRMAEAINLNAASQLYENQPWLSKLLGQPNPNGEHKGKLIKFLYQADLIGGCPVNQKLEVDKAKCKPAELKLSTIKLNEMIMERPIIRLIGIDLSGADLSNSKLSELNLDAANLQSATLTEADLSKTVLTDAKMQATVLRKADLTEALLIRAKLQVANLSEANLAGANFKEADLQYADLQGANLQGANLQGAILKGAKYNQKTVLPEGIDKKGMLLCTMGKDKTSDRLREYCEVN
ncbi:pentapeptide repeat-containing protein [Leptolyngbya sp. 7M]|uniref:pentapeptide repeat-containing protein n=1 Tax=Leptolyngbya sp. 7M TaxID=2812896 RepID=UPI001B8B9CD4|nr:pentapeptide repeat-containing protein [Leptolyngbya sp. 7M]QYO62767.1 pentapeptide repeat-containing protein [Leptolyngbya sp. 7M]